MSGFTDRERLDFLEQDCNEEPLVLHNLDNAEYSKRGRLGFRGLGLACTGRSLRVALDQIMYAVGKRPSVQRLALEQTLGAGAECKNCGFRYFAHKGHIIPCPLCTPALPPGTVAVPYSMVDDALTLLEGWIERYCKPRFKDEHLKNLEVKRAVLNASPRAKDVA